MPSQRDPPSQSLTSPNHMLSNHPLLTHITLTNHKPRGMACWPKAKKAGILAFSKMFSPVVVVVVSVVLLKSGFVNAET